MATDSVRAKCRMINFVVLAVAAQSNPSRPAARTDEGKVAARDAAMIRIVQKDGKGARHSVHRRTAAGSREFNPVQIHIRNAVELNRAGIDDRAADGRGLNG